MSEHERRDNREANAMRHVLLTAMIMALACASTAQARHLPGETLDVQSGRAALAADRPADVAATRWEHAPIVFDGMLGRFLQRDPVGYKDDLNLYAYVRNDPLNLSDPTGRQVAIPLPPPPILTTPQQDQEPWGPTLGEIAEGAKNFAEALGTVATNIVPLTEAAITVLTSDNANGQADPSSGGENTNPYGGPVDRPVIAVDSGGNAIPVGQGEQIAASPSGDYQQVTDSAGRPTGTRLDYGGHRGQRDPAAQAPHAHRPGVTQENGNPHLPVRPRP